MRDVFASPAQFVNPAINRVKVAHRAFPSPGQNLYPAHHFNPALSQEKHHKLEGSIR
jgi:hypothetical protein